MPETISEAVFGQLKALDTCTVSNAIERLKVRLRNEGFVLGAASECRFPCMSPMLGYAVTGRIRSSSPPVTGHCYYDRIDFWRYLATLPTPRVMVLEDVDPIPGSGAFVGEMHAAIGLALDSIGYVTNGAVRDLPAVEAMGFHLFSGSVSVSHAYAHLIEFGEPVEIGGLKISPGDLMHGDRHGVHVIPVEIAADIPREASRIAHSEADLKRFCQSRQFSLEGLSGWLAQSAGDCG